MLRMKIFGLFAVVFLTTHNVASASELIPIHSGEVSSIVVKPNKNNHTYLLKIYSKEKKSPIVSLSRHLYGDIVDVDIIDVDGDQKNELVITTTLNVAAKTTSQDVFEFTSSHSKNSLIKFISQLF